jgi:hypothetical protein
MIFHDQDFQLPSLIGFDPFYRGGFIAADRRGCSLECVKSLYSLSKEAGLIPQGLRVDQGGSQEIKSWDSPVEAHLTKGDEEVCHKEVQPEVGDHTC